jgi:hypothetical protein
MVPLLGLVRGQYCGSCRKRKGLPEPTPPPPERKPAGYGCGPGGETASASAEEKWANWPTYANQGSRKTERRHPQFVHMPPGRDYSFIVGEVSEGSRCASALGDRWFDPGHDGGGRARVGVVGRVIMWRPPTADVGGSFVRHERPGVDVGVAAHEGFLSWSAACVACV